MNKMWMGIPGRQMQWVPAPLISSTIQRNRNIEQIKFDDGGGDVRRSAQYQLQYNFAFSGPAHELEGIDAFNRFASGFYGSGYIHIAHPANFETNVLGAQWSAPALIRQGWSNIYTEEPQFARINNPAYNQPTYNATWNITTPANLNLKKFTVPIPPTHVLHLGASGAATGSAVVQVQPISASGEYLEPVNLTLLADSGPQRMNATFSGADNIVAVDIYLTRTDSSDSTITLTSMMGQLYEIGSVVDLNPYHVQGEGATGMMFVDDAITETYSYMFPPRKGISTSLVEVEAWR